MLSPEQSAAIASLRALFPEPRIVLIGATALAVQRRLSRTTSDVDLVLALDTDAFPGPLSADKNWEQDQPVTQPQRWLYRQLTRFDLLPVGETSLARGVLYWPSGLKMNVHVFGLLMTEQLPLVLPALAVHIAPVPLIMLLKMVSWLDRPGERMRDVEDLTWLFSNYLDPHDDNDFERLLEVGFGDEGHAFALGCDIAAYGVTDVMQSFVRSLEGPHAYALSRARGRTWDEDDAWAAFKRGLGVES